MIGGGGAGARLYNESVVGNIREINCFLRKYEQLGKD